MDRGLLVNDCIHSPTVSKHDKVISPLLSLRSVSHNCNRWHAAHIRFSQCRSVGPALYTMVLLLPMSSCAAAKGSFRNRRGYWERVVGGGEGRRRGKATCSNPSTSLQQTTGYTLILHSQNWNLVQALGQHVAMPFPYQTIDCSEPSCLSIVHVECWCRQGY